MRIQGRIIKLKDEPARFAIVDADLTAAIAKYPLNQRAKMLQARMWAEGQISEADATFAERLRFDELRAGRQYL